MEIKIRNITNDDVNVLFELTKNNYPLDVHTPHTYWMLSEYYSESCFILEIDGKSEGFITSTITPDYIFFWQFAINERYRGKGYSYLLLDKLIEVAKFNKKPISLTIEPDNRNSFRCINTYCSKNNYKFERYSECIISIPNKQEHDYKSYGAIYRILP